MADFPLAARDSTALISARAQLADGANDDAALLDLWVRSKRKSAHTRAAYHARGERFLTWCAAEGIVLRALTLDGLLRYAESLAALSEGSQKAHLASVKALLTFGQAVGYLAANVGAALEISKPRDTLPERILSEEQVQRMLALEPHPGRHLLIRLLYSSGGRVSEVVALQWRDAIATGKAGGQITIVGKGGETRVIKLKKETWAELLAHKPADARSDDPIFRTRTGKPIARSWAWEVVKAAAKRAGLPDGVSPHWMRHAHASHALDRGAPAHLVKDTLGHTNLATTTRYAHARPSESSSDYLPI